MPTNKPRKEPFQSPKGMHDILSDAYYAHQGLFEKAQEVAVYYGFKPIAIPIVEQQELFETTIGIGTDIVDKEMYTLKTKGGDQLALRPEFTAGVMRAYIEHGMQSETQPIMLYSSGPVFRHDKPQKGRYRQLHQFNLEVIGTKKSIADALVIKTIAVILEEAGAKNLVVDINSIGDKDSRTAYLRELTAYYKKHLSSMPAEARDRLKTNPLRLLDSKDPKMIAINVDAPESVASLNPESKRHLKEVLEYLDEMGITYRLNKNLVRGLSYYTHTVFEMIDEGDSETGPLALAGGGRYDYLGTMLGSKKEIPAIGAAIGMDRVIEAPWNTNLSPKINKKPKCYFIQLGFEAKLKALPIIDILRKAHIPVLQSLTKDSLTSQLATAERSGVPYTLIFGQKEALENSVIVKDMQKHSQKTVKIDKLVEYLKEMK
jgi:histidyl-tRNA synthetase